MEDFDGSIKEKRRIDERNKRKRDIELNDLRTVLSKPEGRRVIWRYLSAFQMMAPLFNQNALVMANNVGLHDAGIKFFSEIPKATFFQMQREYESDIRSEATEEVKKII